MLRPRSILTDMSGRARHIFFRGSTPCRAIAVIKYRCAARCGVFPVNFGKMKRDSPVKERHVLVTHKRQNVDIEHYRALFSRNTGVRFSAKAFSASRWSSVNQRSTKVSAARSWASSGGPLAALWMTRLARPRARGAALSKLSTNCIAAPTTSLS